MNKLFSGRFLLTMIAGIVFFILSIRGQLPQDKIMEVILLVVYAYFQRGDRQPPEQPPSSTYNGDSNLPNNNANYGEKK